MDGWVDDRWIDRSTIVSFTSVLYIKLCKWDNTSRLYFDYS